MLLEKITNSKLISLQSEINAASAYEKDPRLYTVENLNGAVNSLRKSQLSTLVQTICKVIHYIVTIFTKKLNAIDALLKANLQAGGLAEKYRLAIIKLNTPIVVEQYAYEIGIEELKKSLTTDDKRPLKITMIGVEYAGLVKVGGLAEAIEGLSRGLADLGHEIRLIFPNYSIIPKSIFEGIPEPIYHTGSDGISYKVYTKTIDGIICQFIDHPTFSLSDINPDVYGPTNEEQAKRFGAFSKFASELVYEQKKETDIIHLHDWHSALVANHLKQNHEEEWSRGDIPAIVFTFHNNARGTQGRMSHLSNLRGMDDNLFLLAVKVSDTVTTVSPTFGIESQTMSRGEGMSTILREAAGAGKFYGILNGANLKRWDPQTNSQLLNWQDLESKEPLPLVYGLDSTLEQKAKAKIQLVLWAQQFMGVKLDPSKPLVTYVGRLDTHHKGLYRFKQAVQSILKHGGQFVCMGTGPDWEAKEILKELRKKHPKGVLILEDYKETAPKKDKAKSDCFLHFQDGDQERPGVGALVRAASEFILIPSNFEPCGLVQFEGWSFGSMAIGSETGGIADSIKLKREFGFLFKDDTEIDQTIKKALEYWIGLSLEERRKVQQTVMIEVKNLDWTHAAQDYRIVYEDAIERKKLRGKEPQAAERLVRKKALQLPSAHFSAEEDYLFKLAQDQHDSSALDPIYRALPFHTRLTVPSPYGHLVNFKKHEKYGALPDGQFVVRAPQAKEVCLLLINEDGTETLKLPMIQNGADWTVCQSPINPNQKYQYLIDGVPKIDPYGRQHVYSKSTNHIVYSVVSPSSHEWTDAAWIQQRASLLEERKPMSIFEVHPISWKKVDGKPLNYRDFAEELAAYLQEHRYTHVELMGILEHPYDPSWGYQVTGYFAPTSRMGSIDDFKYLINYLHERKIGVILDFIPAHFAEDSYGLAQFDGSSEYESNEQSDPFNRFGTPFDFNKKEVREFLVSSAMFWINDMHVDGLRIDCIKNIMQGEKKELGHLFLKDLNAIIKKHGKGAISIAEDASIHNQITNSFVNLGFGFDFRWHITFTHWLLKYFEHPPHKRAQQYKPLVELLRDDCQNQKQILYLSHDQANDTNPLTKSYAELLSSIDETQRGAQARFIHSLLMCLPGKKLNFIGTEGVCAKDWSQYPKRQDKGWMDDNQPDPMFSKMTSRLNELYLTESSLHASDDNAKDLEWIADPEEIVHAYQRKDREGRSLVCLHNFTDKESTFTLPRASVEIFHSNNVEFGGTAAPAAESQKKVKVPPLTTLILREIV